MKNKVINVFNQFWHDFSIAELQASHNHKESSDLSYHDILYLNIIDIRPNHYTATKIADILKVSRPAVTQKINELVKRGYIIKTQSQKDKRIFYLETNPAKSFCTEKNIEKIAVEKLIEKYSNEEVKLLCEMIKYYNDAFYQKMMEEDNHA